MTQLIDVTGLNPKQIALIEEIVTALKMASQTEPPNKQFAKKFPTTEEQLEEIYEEFSWLIADLGVKEPLDRNKVYDL